MFCGLSGIQENFCNKVSAGCDYLDESINRTRMKTKETFPGSPTEWHNLFRSLILLAIWAGNIPNPCITKRRFQSREGCTSDPACSSRLVLRERQLGLPWAVLLALTLLWAGPLSAATITVTTTNNAGPGSLRQAVLDAMPGDVIDCAVTGVVALTSGQISIAKDLTISGPGATNLILSGNLASRIFSITTGTVAISGLTLANGRTDPFDSDGGAIKNGARLTIAGCAFWGNSGYFGGAIVNFGGLLTIANSTFSSNVAAHGGALLSIGTLVVSNCTLSANRANFGGGLYSFGGGTSYVFSSTVASNTALNAGGGIHTEGATIVRNSILAGNSAPTAPDCDTITSQDYNLIQNTSGSSISGATAHNIPGRWIRCWGRWPTMAGRL